MASGDPTEWSGFDPLAAALHFALVSLPGLLIAALAPPGLRLAVLVGSLLLAAVVAPSRWRLRISSEGVDFAQLAAWFVPVKRQRFLLDCTLEVYESWEAAAPEGLFVRGYFDGGLDRDGPCFGPAKTPDFMNRVRAEANAAIARARQALPRASGDLRCPLLQADAAKLDLRGAKRTPENRLREVTVTAPIVLDGLVLPPGTVLVLNDDQPMDPRRPDWFRWAVLAAPLPLPLGVSAPAETRLWFSEAGKFAGGRGKLGPLTIEGFPIDGDQPVVVADGKLQAFTLARETPLGGLTLPAGTQVSTWPEMFRRGPSWHCALTAPLQLPELLLAPNDSLQFDKQGPTVIAAHLANGGVLDGKKLFPGPLPLLPDGRVDRKRAKKRGALER